METRCLHHDSCDISLNLEYQRFNSSVTLAFEVRIPVVGTPKKRDPLKPLERLKFIMKPQKSGQVRRTHLVSASLQFYISETGMQCEQAGMTFSTSEGTRIYVNSQIALSKSSHPSLQLVLKTRRPHETDSSVHHLPDLH